MTFEEAAKILAIAYVGFPNLALRREVIQGWHAYFATESAEIFSTAMMEAVKNNSSGFFPSPGQVNAVIKEMTKKECDRITAGEAWGIVRGASRGSRWDKPDHDFADYPRIANAVRCLGGLDRIGMADHETEMPWLEKRFIEFYESMEERDQKEILPKIEHKQVLALVQETADKKSMR